MPTPNRSYKNSECAEMDEELEERPPRIEWRSNGKGVQVAVVVEDPHTTNPRRRVS
jgi:hypothetical protein